MEKIRTKGWALILSFHFFSLMAGSDVIHASDDYSKALTAFVSSKGQAINRESIYKTIFAITQDGHRVGTAIKIADNLYLTAYHILDGTSSNDRIHSYMTDESFAFTILTQDESNDIALLQTQEMDTPRAEPLVRFSSDIPEVGDHLSHFLLLNEERADSYAVELRGKPPFVQNTEVNDFYLGRLNAPRGSFTYEIEGFVLPHDIETIRAHLERNRKADNSPYGPEILSGPDFARMTTLNGYNGASGGGVFRKTESGYELVGILTLSVTEKHLITIPKSPRGFTRLQQNYSFFAHRNAIVDLLNRYRSD